MKTHIPIAAVLLLTGLTGCGQKSVHEVPEHPQEPQSAQLLRDTPNRGYVKTDLVITGETVYTTRHLSPEEVLLTAEPGEDVTDVIRPDMTLVDDTGE